MKSTGSLLALLAMFSASALYGAADIQQAVQDYASFFRRNSVGTLANFKLCFVPEERGNVYALPQENEKKGQGSAVIVSSDIYGNICEVKYHTGDPADLEQIVLKQQNGEWFASLFYTANLHRKLREDCAGKLQQLAKALQMYSMLNNGRYPSGNDAAGWEELRKQDLIKSAGDYTCPQCGKSYSYIGGKSVMTNANTPLAWCNKHTENGNLSNVLLVSGKVTAMPSPVTHIPAPAAAAPQDTASAASAAVSQNAPAAATPADWVKGPDANWFVHYDDALAAAKRENKKILLLHTGSDWCPWCKRLADDVLSRDEFRNFARSKLVLLYFDSPSGRHPMGQAQREYVKRTEQQLGISGGYPCTFILDTDEKIVGQIGGYSDLDNYLAALKKYVGEDTAADASAAPATPAAPAAPTPPPAAAPQRPAAAGWITAPRRDSFVLSARQNAVPRGKTAAAAPEHWLKGPTPDWYIHLDDAVAAAKSSGRKIYALHTGSDWCPPCKRLEKNILSTNKFKEFARNNIILLFVDAPRRKPIPSDQREYNDKLALQLKFGNGVPAILLLNSDGIPIDRIGGRRNVEDHIYSIKQALAKHK